MEELTAAVLSVEEAMADGGVRDCSGEHGGGRGWARASREGNGGIEEGLGFRGFWNENSVVEL